MDVTPLPYIPRPQEEARLRTYLLDRLQGKRGVPKALFLGGAPGVGKRTLLRHVCAGERCLREFRVVHVLPRDAPDPAAEEGPRKGLGKAAEITGEVLNLVRPLEGLVFNGVRILVEEQLFGARKAERVGRPPELSILDADGPVLLIVHGVAPEDVEGLQRYARLVREAHHRDSPVTILFLDSSVLLRPEDPDGGDPRLVEALPALTGLRRFLEDARQLEVLHLRAFSEAECRETILGLDLSMEWAAVLWQISEGRPAELDALWKVVQTRRVIDRWSAEERPIAKPAWKLGRDFAIKLLGPRMPPGMIHEPRLIRSLFLAAAMGTAFLPQAVAECAYKVDPRRDEDDGEAWEDLWIDILEHEDPSYPPLAFPRRVDGGPEILAGDERRFFVHELRHPAVVNVLRAALRRIWSGEERPEDEEDEALETERLMNGCRAIEAWLERSFRKSWSQALDYRAALLRVQNRDDEAVPLEDLARRLRLEKTLWTEVERERRRVENGADARGLFDCLLWHGETLYELGEHRRSIEAQLEAKSLADEPGLPVTGGIRYHLLSNLGVILTNEGRYAEAAPILSEGWELALGLYGSEHPNLFDAVNNYAALLDCCGRYDEAEPLYRWVLDARERVLGAEHRQTLRSVNNLALLLQNRGLYEDAEELFRRALAWRERVLGAGHAETLISKNNLAILLSIIGRFSEADPFLREVLKAREWALGPEHPDTLDSVNNLAGLLQGHGQHDEAERLFRRVLAVRARLLAPDHPDTMTSVGNLAGILEQRGRYEEAERLFRQCLEGRERVLGPDHPDTLTSVHCLAGIRRRRGDDDEAARLFLQASNARARVLGPDHPLTMASASNFADVLASRGQASPA